jgi:hypothetical protein
VTAFTSTCADISVSLSAEYNPPAILLPIGNDEFAEITVRNVGPDSADNIIAAFNATARISTVVPSSSDVQVSSLSNSVTLTKTALGSGESFSAKIFLNLPAFSGWAASAVAASSTPDPDPTNNTATVVQPDSNSLYSDRYHPQTPPPFGGAPITTPVGRGH